MAAEILDYDWSTAPQHTELVSDNDQNRAAGDLAEKIDTFGDINCIKTYGVTDRYGNPRTRLRAAMFIGASKYAFRITQHSPDYAKSSGMVVMLPGFTEDPAHGTAKALHTEVANEFPEKDVVSICSDGYNEDGSQLNVKEMGRSFDEMALARLSLASSLAAGKPVLQNGLSKGTVLTHHMAQQNAELNLIDSEGLIYHSPALVPPENIGRDMVLKFPPHIYADSVREAIHHPIAALRAIHLPSLRIVPAYLCDIYNLLHGTEESSIDELLTNGARIGIVAGDKDPLAQLPMWRRQQAKHPGKVELLVKHGQGHGASVDALTAAREIRIVRNLLDQDITSYS